MSDMDFSDLFGNEPIDFECPNCNNEFEVTLNQAGTTVTCPHCKIKINLEKDDSFDETKSNIDNSLNKLDELFKNFGK